MKIGLYFGSFNPVHIGHLIIASHVANNSDLDQVWFVVSPQNPLKKAGTLLNEYHRLHLIQVAIENDPKLKWTDVEFKLPRPSYTIDTLAYLEEKYPKHIFSLILGSDSFQNISNWKNGDVLQSRYKIYVYERPAFPITSTNPNAIQLTAPLLDISSTQVRSLVGQGKSIRYLVPEKVREEIEMGGYYKKELH